MDETTPHMHIVFVPVIHTKDKNGTPINKIACSEYWKGKDSYKRLQDNFYKYVVKSGFDLERGNTKENTHIPIETLKVITNYENIKYELQTEPIKKLETQNTSLILAQNKQLLEYNKKLKCYLVKSFTTIKKVDELEQENADLKYENQKLENKVYDLTNYIKNTFEVVKHLFNFPLDRFKRIVDNFIKNK